MHRLLNSTLALGWGTRDRGTRRRGMGRVDKGTRDCSTVEKERKTRAEKREQWTGGQENDGHIGPS